MSTSKRDHAHRLADGTNAKLRPLPVAILGAQEVDDDFHARFSCIGRRYLYRIVNRRAPLALEAGRAWRVPVVLYADEMNKAAQVLVGHHDFTTFRSAHCQAESPVKTLDRLTVSAVRRDDRDRGGGALASSTTRCARWSAAWSWSGAGNGPKRI